MAHDKDATPRHYPGVMVSSTFMDLGKHRLALIKAIKGQGLTDVAMENDTAKPDVDIIDSSFQMVRDASAYIAIISHKYGQTPISPDRNPGQRSITELEFDEAQRLGRPILLFIMGDEHPVRKADVETDPANREKLNAFRERAKQIKPDSQVHRVYATFDSLEEFTSKAIQAVAALRRYLDEQSKPSTLPRTPAPTITGPHPIPTPPAFYAEPAYIGSHTFVGRQAQLDVLNDWAVAADPHPVLLFDAIGGAGKSMLTWEWTTTYATQMREDWAGRFWYSFYERAALMVDFCQHALAYITGDPLDRFRTMKTLELGDVLLHHLRARPWLLVLDGLERVLVAYHRFDAADMLDEEANQPTDQIARRDPCTAIRPEDDDLLRALSAAAPSKLLITSRLVPRVLLNPASLPIPGVRRESLPGLRPADAESLLRSCEITGDSQAIQNYLKRHCDCHPLVTGVLAGLINDYPPNKGNFDAWVADPDGGGLLNLADLDLVQKRNHILKAALEALPEKGYELLSILALLPETVDYATLSAFNPHMPPKPEEVDEPGKPEDSPWWEDLSEADKEQEQEEYQAALQRRNEYERALKVWNQSRSVGLRELAHTVHDLERRGLLQYDRQTRRYGLHPVVRGIAAGGLRLEQTTRYGQRVVDYFSQQASDSYRQAETLEDVRYGLHIVRTLLKMGEYRQASVVYISGLSRALSRNLEAYAEILSLLRPFFPNGWTTLPVDIDGIGVSMACEIAYSAAAALHNIGALDEALAVKATILMSRVKQKQWGFAGAPLVSMSITLGAQNRLAKEDYFGHLALDVAALIDDNAWLLRARVSHYRQLAQIGQWEDADMIWQLIDSRSDLWWRIDTYLHSDAETIYAFSRFWRGDLQEEHLVFAEKVATSVKNRHCIQNLHRLRGAWRLEQSQCVLAAESLHEAVRMARAVGMTDTEAETLLAVAKFQLGQLLDPRQDAEQLAQAKGPFHRGLADLWLAAGDHEQAKKHALLAYKEAWADGEPYVFRYELNKAITLLHELNVEIPRLPPYDPAKDEKLPWEDEVVAAIEELRLVKQAKQTPKTNE